MKRIYVLLAMVLVLTGCAGKGKVNDISVKDALYPYDVEHKKGTVTITFYDDTQTDTVWQTQMIMENICQVTRSDADKEGTVRYDVTGVEEGAEQLTFLALQGEETASFTLSLLVNVDSEGKVTVQSYQHRERKQASVDENGLNYQWNVDIDGILNFSFFNGEDLWSVRGDGEGVCTLRNAMSTPSGCRFSAQAYGEGQTSVMLVGKETQRKINVTLQVDSDGNLEVTSVQEQ